MHRTDKNKTDKNLFSYIKIDKEILTFGDIETEKNKFYRHKSPVFLKGVDIEKIPVSNKIQQKKTISTLLVTHIMIIKLSHYI